MNVLSAPQNVDLPAILELLNDPEIQRWVRRDDRKYRVEDLPALLYESRPGTAVYPWSIVVDDVARGCIVLRDVDLVSRVGLMDLLLVRDPYLALKAGRDLVRYGYETLGLNRIEVRCFADNRLTPWLCGRFNATMEGIAKRAVFTRGAYKDVMQFALLREEWDAEGR